MTEYARKTTIDFCGIDLEVFMLPDGGYTLSQNQVSLAVDEPEYNFRRFLKGNSPEALPIKGLIFGTVMTEGAGRPINSTPIKVALAYWTYRASKGNVKAQAILMTGTEDSLIKLADKAFGVVKTEVEYSINREQNFQQNEQILIMLNALMSQNQSVLAEMAEIKSELKSLKPLAEEYHKINQALIDLSALKPLLEEITLELKNNPNQRTKNLSDWLDELGLAALTSGQRKSLGRIVSDFLKIGNLRPPDRTNCNQYPESMTPLIRLASQYLV